MAVDTSLTDVYTLTMIDGSSCSPSLTAPTLSVNTEHGYMQDLTNSWIAYKIGADADLVITWVGASNGNCMFTTSVIVNGQTAPGWIVSSQEQMALSSSFVTQKYAVTQDASTTVATSDSSLDGSYQIAFIMTDSTNLANQLTTETTVRVYWNECTYGITLL